jgi:hypothetical protein
MCPDAAPTANVPTLKHAATERALIHVSTETLVLELLNALLETTVLHAHALRDSSEIRS